MKYPNRLRLVFYAAAAVGMAAALFSLVYSGAQPVAPLFKAGCIGALASLLAGTVTVRCPHCGFPLGLNELFTPIATAAGNLWTPFSRPSSTRPDSAAGDGHVFAQKVIDKPLFFVYYIIHTS